MSESDAVEQIARTLAHWRCVAEEAMSEVERLEAENAKLRAVAVAALAAYKSPGYSEHTKLAEALTAAGVT